MHWLRLIVFAGVPILLALAGPALMIVAWSSGAPMQPALLAAVLLMSTAIIVHLIGRFIEPPPDQPEQIWQELASLRRQMEALREDMAQWKQAAAHAPAATSPTLPQGQHGQHGQQAQEHPAQGHAAHGQQDNAAASSMAEPEQRQHAPSTAERPLNATPALDRAQAADMQLYMEPVFDLNGERAVMYRALPALPAEGGRVYLGWHGLARAVQLGRGGAVQLATLADCLQFVRDLRAQGAQLPVICPLQALVLEDAQAARVLADTLREAPEAPEILFAVRVEELQAITRQARQGLFRLAQWGGTFVLECGQALPAHPPAWAETLPMRQADISAKALVQAHGRAADLQTALAGLAGRGLEIIVHGVDSPQELALARAVAHLARGRQLAPPRRVRRPGEEQVMAAAQ